MSTYRNITDVALEYVGRGETEGNNRGPFIDTLFGRASRGQNWCAAFVSHCLSMSGWGRPRWRGRPTFGAKRIAKQLVAGHGATWVYEPKRKGPPLRIGQPRAGDIVVWHKRRRGWRWSDMIAAWQGHIGIVVEFNDELHRAYYSHANKLHTLRNGDMLIVEGNAGPRPQVVRLRMIEDYAYRFGLFGIVRLPG